MGDAINRSVGPTVGMEYSVCMYVCSIPHFYSISNVCAYLECLHWYVRMYE